MITLIISHFQNDFITGTVSVKNARNAVDEVKKYIKKHKDEIEKIIFIIDWHPYNHCSFKKYGGELQYHCIQYTPGACIEPKLLKYIQSLYINYDVCKIGEIEEVDDLGAFDVIDYVQDNFGDRYYLDDIVIANPKTEFVFCGVCTELFNTLINIKEAGIEPKVFMPGIISLDGGKCMIQFMKDNGIKKTT